MSTKPPAMTTTPSTTSETIPTPLPGKSPKSLRWRGCFNPSPIAHFLNKLGLGFFVPYVRLAAGDEPEKQVRQILIDILLPGLAMFLFFMFWTVCAKGVHTDSTRIPTPGETWSAWLGMRAFAADQAVKEAEFTEKMEKLAAIWDKQAQTAKDAGESAKATASSERAASYRNKEYAGPPTFYAQIRTSLLTVTIGFIAATLIAIPLGILCGLNRYFFIALNPLVQIFKPVSPLAWLPIVFVFVTALYDPPADTHFFGRAMFISAGTVTLCSLWPTLINTAFGVAGIDKDHLNVARVLKLSWFKQLTSIILPSALPLIFTGLRLSLGVGWMVLIAADMLAQNPGLGKFVWDTFQNGSTESMAQIVVAVFAIGIIGFFLDRVMFAMQRLVTFDERAI